MAGDNLHQLALGANALEEQHELQLEEDHGVDGRTPICCITVLDPVTNKGPSVRSLY